MKEFETKEEARAFGYRRNTIAFISLLLLVLIPYSNSFHASWHLDDGPNITENKRSHLKEFSWTGVKEAFLAAPLTGGVAFTRPVSRFSLAVNHYFSGNEIFGYHVVNVFIHLVASFFLYLFLASTLELPLLRARYGSSSHFVALVASALWAIHPIQVQAVTYIVQRMASIAGMFYIMAMYFYVKAWLSSDRRGKFGFLAACACAGILSFGSKENAILLPVSILLFRLLIVQGFTREALKSALVDFSLKVLLPLLLALVVLFASYDIIERVFALYETRAFTLCERLLTESRVMIFYISLLLYPISTRFSIDHPIVISTSLFDPLSTILSILVIGILLASATVLSRKQPLVAFATFFFFLNHAAESTFLPMELVFEHRNYIPSMFFFVPITAGILQLFNSFSQNRRMQAFLIGSVILVLITLGSTTYIRNSVWRDEKSLWTDCLSKYPSSFRAHLNLGRYHHLKGDGSKASEEYHSALSGTGIQSPKEKGVAYFNLGLLAHERGDHEKAISLYTKALEVDPCCPGANNNMASILLEPSFGRTHDALRLLDMAIECRRDTEVTLAWGNKAILLWRLGRVQEAITAARKAIEMNPDNPLNLLRLGYMLKENGDFVAASVHFRRVLELSPQDIPAFLFLAEAYIAGSQMELGRSTLRRFFESVSRNEMIRYLENHPKTGEGTELVPRLGLLSPFLLEVNREKGFLSEKFLDPFMKTNLEKPVPITSTDKK